jgi:hypothetical protein
MASAARYKYGRILEISTDREYLERIRIALLEIPEENRGYLAILSKNLPEVVGAFITERLYEVDPVKTQIARLLRDLNDDN